MTAIDPSSGAGCIRTEKRANKMAPKIGAIWKRCTLLQASGTGAGRLPARNSSDPAARHVAVADGRFGIGQQPTIERNHQAAEETGGGREAGNGEIGHLGPLIWWAAAARCVWGSNYVYQMPETMHLFA